MRLIRRKIRYVVVVVVAGYDEEASGYPGNAGQGGQVKAGSTNTGEY